MNEQRIATHHVHQVHQGRYASVHVAKTACELDRQFPYTAAVWQ